MPAEPATPATPGYDYNISSLALGPDFPDLYLQEHSLICRVPETYNIRAYWAEAENFIFRSLRNGWHPEVLNNLFWGSYPEDEEPYSNTYFLLWNQSCCQIMESLKRNNAFENLPSFQTWEALSEKKLRECSVWMHDIYWDYESFQAWSRDEDIQMQIVHAGPLESSCRAALEQLVECRNEIIEEAYNLNLDTVRMLEEETTESEYSSSIPPTPPSSSRSGTTPLAISPDDIFTPKKGGLMSTPSTPPKGSPTVRQVFDTEIEEGYQNAWLENDTFDVDSIGTREDGTLKAEFSLVKPTTPYSLVVPDRECRYGPWWIPKTPTRKPPLVPWRKDSKPTLFQKPGPLDIFNIEVEIQELVAKEARRKLEAEGEGGTELTMESIQGKH